MRTVLKVSTVLSWINLIIWGIIPVMGVLGALMVGNPLVLVLYFVMGATALHSFAALKLHASIRNPAIPLSNQTPAGIRFVGVIALFLGVIYLGCAVIVLQNTQEIIKLMQAQYPTQLKTADLVNNAHTGAVFLLFSGISIAVNVILNFRLLRWYFFMKGMI
ncbi:MAG TPA: hypothetical protein VK563_13215 [Puia sp.]|nr:hypothetical protein [Puia sp.]